MELILGMTPLFHSTGARFGLDSKPYVCHEGPLHDPRDVYDCLPSQAPTKSERLIWFVRQTPLDSFSKFRRRSEMGRRFVH